MSQAQFLHDMENARDIAQASAETHLDTLGMETIILLTVKGRDDTYICSGIADPADVLKRLKGAVRYLESEIESDFATSERSSNKVGEA